MEPTHFAVTDIISNWLEPLDRKLRITFENVLTTTIEPTLDFLAAVRAADYKSTHTIVCESGKYLVASLLKTVDALLNFERKEREGESGASAQPANLSTTLSASSAFLYAFRNCSAQSYLPLPPLPSLHYSFPLPTRRLVYASLHPHIWRHSRSQGTAHAF